MSHMTPSAMAQRCTALIRNAFTAGLVLSFLCCITTVRAEKYALLVGVSGYPSLPQNLQLDGPRNDVELMRSVLLQRGFAASNIRVLADQVKAANAEPTRAAIMGELQSLAAKAAKDDFVFLLFAGHGSQQPARSGAPNPEPDGLDEVFLPRDIGSWNDAIGAVQNAIVDDELGEAVTAIRNRGAFVWALFDTCHSGTITRGVEAPQVRYRDVPRGALGIPDAAVARAQKAAAALSGRVDNDASTAPMTALQSRASLTPGAGGFVAFYAAQSWEKAPESPQPAYLSAGDPNKRQHGVFTYAVAQVLAMNPAMTYRQAGEQILQRYRQTVRGQPTPLFEGASLDAPVFGTAIGPQVLQWKIEKTPEGLRIAAGALHQFSDGAMFAVVTNPADPDAAAIGQLQAAKVEVLRSQLVPVVRDGKTQFDVAKLPADTYARLLEPNLSLGFRVSLPVAAVRTEGTDAARGRAVLLALTKEKFEGLAPTWLPATQAGDVRLLLRSGHLWFLPPSGELVESGSHKTLSVDLGGRSEGELREMIVATLNAMARVANLLKLATLTGGTAVAHNVEVSMSYERQGKTGELRSSQVPLLRDGDKLRLAVHNRHKEAVDANVLFVDSRFGIHHISAERFEPDGRQVLDMGTVETASTVGQESVMVIVSAVQRGEPMAHFGFLEQQTLAATRDVTPRPLTTLLQAATFSGGSTRGLAGPARTLGTTAFRLFTWNAVR